MRQMRWIGAFVLCGAIAAGWACSEAQADLKSVKVRSVQLSSAPESKEQTDFLAAAIGGELLKRGAVLDENGITITGDATWEKNGGKLQIKAKGVDVRGLSFSVAVEELRNLTNNTYAQMSKAAAAKFADDFAEQIAAQRAHGQSQSNTPAGSSVVPTPDKAISSFGYEAPPSAPKNLRIVPPPAEVSPKQ